MNSQPKSLKEMIRFLVREELHSLKESSEWEKGNSYDLSPEEIEDGGWELDYVDPKSGIKHYKRLKLGLRSAGVDPKSGMPVVTGKELEGGLPEFADDYDGHPGPQYELVDKDPKSGIGKYRLKSAIRKDKLSEVSPVFYPAIKKGMEAGRKASQQQRSRYRGKGGESFEDEIARIRRTAKQQHDRYDKMQSLSDHLRKVFGKDASGGTARASVRLSDDVIADIGAESASLAGIDNPKFIISIRKGNEEVQKKELFAGLGAKQSIARFLKKLQKKLQENKSMKVTKAQLKEMVRKVIRSKLLEMDLEERGTKPQDHKDDDDGRMSDEELSAHLDQEREKSKRRRVQKKRHAAKQSARGMELECGPGGKDDMEPRSLALVFGEDELEEAKLSENSGAVDDFCAAYIEAALWSSTDDDGEPLDDKYSVDDCSEECLRAMVKDCEKFQTLAGEMIEDKEEQAGHDFWLTRNGHGAGFWDGDWPEHGDELTKLSEKFGEVNLYVGDDGMIHQM